ncbi:MAG: Queuine tRNA-ribosyltransferase [Candidatus Peregrinibacteria bacterium Greene0416_19]|nr:MAG: Queuine tRNA-ribosyltransferase [Candidatus Peregrinibacteria bacterium Greene0416_19]
MNAFDAAGSVSPSEAGPMVDYSPRVHGTRKHTSHRMLLRASRARHRYPVAVFELHAQSTAGRRGLLHTSHGPIPTPAFMPVATTGAMKGLAHRDLLDLGADILLCNTYHLHLQPGESVVADAGGLHRFIGWDKPMLTDSGGFQVFSLRTISDITEEGVHFRSHLSGAPLFLGPMEAMHIQHALGADIIMCFDQCPPSTAPREEIEAAVDRTIRWARTCKEEHERLLTTKSPRSPTIPRSPKKSHFSSDSSASSVSSPLLFGIVQGGLDRGLRKKCAEELIAIGFDGYAVGGLAVGESEEEMFGVIDDLCPLLPSDKPRYLMGVGGLGQVQVAVAKGIDMFDCVLPVREGRHGTLYLSDGSRIRISSSRYMHDHSPIDALSPSPLSREHSKSYLCHLLRIGERYGETIAAMQNLGMTLQCLRQLRQGIGDGQLMPH